MALTKIVNGEIVSLTVEEQAQFASESEAWFAERAATATKRAALSEIARLEALETPRRLAEAMLGQEDPAGWLQSNRDLIAIERAKL